MAKDLPRIYSGRIADSSSCFDLALVDESDLGD